MTLHTQLVTMGAMILGGVYLGLAKDTFQRILTAWRRFIVLRYSLEIIFWLMQTFLLYYVLYRLNGGVLRLYFFIAVAFGFTCYMALFQQIYQKILNWIILCITKLAVFLYKIFMMPILFVIKLILRIIQFMLRMLGTITANLFKNIVLPIIKWILPKKIYDFITISIVKCSTMVNTLYVKGITFLRNLRR